jgi:hypothetical protein
MSIVGIFEVCKPEFCRVYFANLTGAIKLNICELWPVGLTSVLKDYCRVVNKTLDLS